MKRFWSKVNKYSGVFGADGHYPTECWEWLAGLSTGGYGRFKIGGKTKYAHRIAWILAFGHIADDSKVLHRCDNPSCVRESHLFVGTAKDNSQDMVRKKRWYGGNRKGEKNHKSKLDNKQVLLMREKFRNGAKVTELAHEFNINHRSVSSAVRYITWSHLP